MIVVTGSEGFIGSNLIKKLTPKSIKGVVHLDIKKTDINTIYDWLSDNAKNIECIFHLGAITDTTETDKVKLELFNTNCTLFFWSFCTHNKIPLIYASSAATYGDGKEGFDDEADIRKLKPLNLYGWSKQKADSFILKTKRFISPPHWYGLKFFNVYGYGEAHKEKMASVMFHTYNQIKETGQMKLFKSHKDNCLDGEQQRDFVFIDDIVDVCVNFMDKKSESGIYNVGTGKARSYNDIAKTVFKCLDIEENIKYIDIPENIRKQYQYFTEAKIDKLKNVECDVIFHELEEGISKYIKKLENENS